MQKNISFIIPAYNAEKTIEKTILSFQTQRPECVEIVVVDNGCTDGTVEVVKQINKKDLPEIILMHMEQNDYPWGGKNTGLNAAKGKYINFFDSDDALVEGAVDYLLDLIEKENADVYIYGYAQTAVQGSIEDVFKENPCSKNYTWQKWNSYFNWRELISRKLLIDNEIECPIGFGEDIYISIMASALAEKVYIVPEILYLYTKSEGGLTENQYKYFELFPYSREMIPQTYYKCFMKESDENEKNNIRFAALSWYYIMSFSGLIGATTRAYAREIALFNEQMMKYFPDYKSWSIKGINFDGIDFKTRLLVSVSKKLDRIGMHKCALILYNFIFRAKRYVNKKLSF